MALALASDRRRWALVTFIGGMFVAVGVFLLLAPSVEAGARTTGAVTVLFFGACTLVGVWQLVDTRPRLVFDAHGVTDRTLGVGRIPWSEVQGADLVVVGDQPFIALDLRDPQPYLDRLSPLKQSLARANAALGLPPFLLNLAHVRADPYDVLDLVRKSLVLYPGPPPPPADPPALPRPGV